MQERNQVGLSLKNGESLRISVCHAADWTRGRVDNSDDFAAKQNPLCGFLVCRHPLCRYLPCASILAFLCMHRRGGGIIPTPLNMRFKIVSFCHIA